jgi:hypothetical protein
MSTAHLPILIHDLKCNVFIRRSCFKSDLHSLGVLCVLKEVLGSAGFVNEIWVEDVKLVSKDNLRRRIILVIMHLIVLVPIIPCLYSVEVLGLSGFVLLRPTLIGKSFFLLRMPEELSCFIQLVELALVLKVKSVLNKTILCQVLLLLKLLAYLLLIFLKVSYKIKHEFLFKSLLFHQSVILGYDWSI